MEYKNHDNTRSGGDANKDSESKNQQPIGVQATQHGNFVKTITPNKIKSYQKKGNRISYTEFTNYVDNFMQIPTEKKITNAIQLTEIDHKIVNRDVYATYKDPLRDRLCASYIFKGDITSDLGTYDSELVVDKSKLNSLTAAVNPVNTNKMVDFFVDTKLLESFYADDLAMKFEQYKRVVERCNRYRSQITDVLVRRTRARVYFKLYGTIHREIKDAFQKCVIRKKKRLDEFEEKTLAEFLEREIEFLEVFGKEDQFEFDAMTYDDIINSDESEYEKYL